jgi:hypothetical protein
MAQIFHPSTNTIAKASIFGFLLLVGAALLIAAEVERSSYVTGVNYPKPQPVQFSHEHHVGGLGIDCRYCHTSVTESSTAGIPSTKTCMTCHSQVWTNARLLEPVRESWRTGVPIAWTRVNDVPDFAHFPHDIHVNRGVACQSCHGKVNEMPLMWRARSLQMEWCLSCHRNPGPNLRPRAEVFNMDWHLPVDQETRGQEIAKKYGINSYQITRCSTCHY